MTARALTWTATAKRGQTLPVLDGSITVDSTRCPQVTADLTLPHLDYATTKGFDPYTRAPVYLDVMLSTAIGGTLATFATPVPIPANPGQPYTPPTEAVPEQPYIPPTYDTGTSYPAEQVFYDPIPDSTTNGWSMLSGTAALSTASTQVQSAPRALYRALTTNALAVYGKDVSGLVVGREYRLTAWFRPTTVPRGYGVGVAGLGSTVPTDLEASVYEDVSFTFTATATTHTLELHTYGQVRIDDISLTRLAYSTPGTGEMIDPGQPYVPGQPATPGQPYVPPTPEQPGVAGTLANLDWNNKASTPQRLESAVAPTIKRRRLRLYVTEVTVNEMASTFDVRLASADHLLTELVNLGAPWMPPVYTQSGDVAYSYLSGVWGEFFEQYRVPLSARAAGISTGLVTNLPPWETGENAWSYLDRVRTEANRRYVVNTRTGAVTFPSSTPPTPYAIGRTGATGVTARRSVDNGFDVMNQYAAAVAVHWTDGTGQDRPDRWDIAYDGDDWRETRRTFVEDRDMPSVGTGSIGLASSRLQRKRMWRRVTTVTIPFDAAATPFIDLSEHPRTSSIQSIVFDYATGDVTTTYLEAD